MSAQSHLTRTQLAVERLNIFLPLHQRQQALNDKQVRLHAKIFQSFLRTGGPPHIAGADEASLEILTDADVTSLAKGDSIVLRDDGPIEGAYPFSSRPTPHVVTVSGHHVFAMCALDALAMSPMFQMETRIDSICSSTGTPIVLEQRGQTVSSILPGYDIRLGINWDHSCDGVAAFSVCKDISFFATAALAEEWQGDNPGQRWIFTIDEAIDFATAFFLPLMDRIAALDAVAARTR